MNHECLMFLSSHYKTHWEFTLISCLKSYASILAPCDNNYLKLRATKELNLIIQNWCQKMFQSDTAVCSRNPQEQSFMLLEVNQQQAASWPEGPLKLLHYPTMLDRKPQTQMATRWTMSWNANRSLNNVLELTSSQIKYVAFFFILFHFCCLVHKGC